MNENIIVEESTLIVNDSIPIIDDSEQLKVRQFKIETPIGSVESDSGNHMIDVFSVIIILVVGTIAYKLIKKWK